MATLPQNMDNILLEGTDGQKQIVMDALKDINNRLNKMYDDISKE